MNIFNFIAFVSNLTVNKLRGQFLKGEYQIKNGYRHRKSYNYDDDRTYTDEYQKEIYEQAKNIFKENNYNSVIDIGCGSAFKLLKYFGENETLGIDVNPTYDYLLKKYPNKKWANATDTSSIPKKTDIIISADVIEHVLRPDELLEMISKIEFKFLFLSTPERDMLCGIGDYGPPKNPTHVREWNAYEFQKFVAEYFNIVSHQITNVGQATQLLICTPKS